VPIPPEFDLTGRVAVVTGGGSGIGKATARLLAQRSADVAICGRKAEKLDQTAQGLSEETGRRILAVPADVRKPEQCAALMEAVMAEFGRIDILINNAGGAHGHKSLAKMDPSAWDRDVSLNLNSAMYCSQAALPHLRASKGCVVNISSMAGVNGTAGVAAYSAAKAGLQMFTRVAASEWGAYGIRVNAVACGMIATEAARNGWEKNGFDAAGAAKGAFALRRYGEMEEAAQAIVFMASDAASYISGDTLVVGGGPKLGGMVELD
jgi:NAD(P)-dependent dehydrogenase (short-subunit alcohol dehydrogenase family)